MPEFGGGWGGKKNQGLVMDEMCGVVLLHRDVPIQHVM